MLPPGLTGAHLSLRFSREDGGGGVSHLGRIVFARALGEPGATLELGFTDTASFFFTVTSAWGAPGAAQGKGRYVWALCPNPSYARLHLEFSTPPAAAAGGCAPIELELVARAPSHGDTYSVLGMAGFELYTPPRA
jgi:hypothetical protein